MPAETLDEFADLLDGVTVRAAVIAAPLVLDAARADWAAGRSPDGAAWPARKDGGAPQIAALTAGATATARGDVITLEVPDDLKPHQRSRRLPSRRTIPGRGDPIPPSYERAMEQGLEQALGEIE